MGKRDYAKLNKKLRITGKLSEFEKWRLAHYTTVRFIKWWALYPGYLLLLPAFFMQIELYINMKFNLEVIGELIESTYENNYRKGAVSDIIKYYYGDK